MAKFWREPLDPARHVDHFYAGGSVRRVAPARGPAFSYFVQVAGFTFEFASPDQVLACAAHFELRIHRSSRRPTFDPEKGEWQAWHERLPARILKRSKRARVVKALRDAHAAFAADLR
jgi:hypothetical protein